MTDNQRVELVLSELAKAKNGRLDVQKFLQNEIKDVDQLSYQRIILFIDKKGFVKRLSSISSTCLIQPDGRDIVESGGYLKYIEKTLSDQEEQSRQDKTKADLDKLNLRLTGFYYKWRWIPFVLSIAAIIISLIALIWS